MLDRRGWSCDNCGVFAVYWVRVSCLESVGVFDGVVLYDSDRVYDGVVLYDSDRVYDGVVLYDSDMVYDGVVLYDSDRVYEKMYGGFVAGVDWG